LRTSSRVDEAPAATKRPLEAVAELREPLGLEPMFEHITSFFIVVIRTVIDYFLGREINELGGTDA